MSQLKPVCGPIMYFVADELECKGSRKKDKDGKPIPGTGVIKLDPRFANALVELRKEWGRPLVLNSCCRTPQHNATMSPKGHPTSLHLTENPKWPTVGTAACDVRWRGWSEAIQKSFAQMALDKGWRVGLHDGFCHIDRGHDVGIKPRIFLYGTYTGGLYHKLKP